ncbi:hypothetical protein EC991_007694 [Linnemannia zychae]|nr:hypothetical protein EC991_007694 [Linnemannia zychae]
MVPFLKGPDYQILEPRRIAAVPGVVLDVVVGGELTAVEVSSLQRTAQGLSITNPPQQSSSSIQRNPVYGLEEEAMQNYNHMEPPATLQSSSRPSQAIPARDQHGSGIRISASTKSQPNRGTTITRKHDAPQDLGTATSMSLMQVMISASQGNADAQLALGNRYREGREVHRDLQAAMDWYLKAADQKHAQAQFMIGMLYFQNEFFRQLLSCDQDNVDSVQADETILKDNDKALEWFLKAAQQGLADAQLGVVMAMMEIDDNPNTERRNTVFDWSRKAANQNCGPAQLLMGLICMDGLGGPKDGSQASKWFLKAVGRSSGAAERGLGQLYDEGNGVPQDISKAFEWYLKATEQGSSRGQLKVADHYENGKGVPANREKAIEWYTQALKDGNQDAKVALERLRAK